MKPARHILFSEPLSQDALKELTLHLRAGVDVEFCREENGILMLSVVGRKKKGRPSSKNIDMALVFKKRAAGVPVEQLAKEFDCSPSYIYTLMKAEKERNNYGN